MSNAETIQRMYSDIAEWWYLLSSPVDYEEEATFFRDVLLNAADGSIESVLELGSGGGNNASHLKSSFQMTLVDLSEDMLTMSRTLNPELEHVQGDMRTVRLDRQFDAVFVHDAISYMTTLEELKRAIETAFVHCKPGGVALFVPDHVRENYAPDTDCGGHDGEERSMRYLEWSYDPDPTDTTCITDYVYVLREADGSTKTIHDRHVEGLFPRADWLRLFEEVGFTPSVVPFNHSELEPGTYEIFVCKK